MNLTAEAANTVTVQKDVSGTGYPAARAAVPVAMAPAAINPDLEPSGVRLYDGACLIPFYVASATTATNSAGFAEVTNR